MKEEEEGNIGNTFWGGCDLPNPLSKPWILKSSKEAGCFAISNRVFMRGELILTERPTTWTKAWHPFSDEEKYQIEKDVDCLPPNDRNAFYSMSNAYPDVSPASSGIYMTNAFDMPYLNGDEDSKACGMFLAIARLNHSCVPNAQQTYIPPNSEKLDNDVMVGHEVLYATRDIAVGEELCDCYIELRQSTEQRRKELVQHYRFTCTCTACGALHDADMSEEALKLRKEDDLRRKRAKKLEEDLFEFVSMGEMTMAIDLGCELIKLLEHDKSKGWGERYIAEACVNTSTLLLEGGRRNQAVALLHKAHSWNVLLQGEDSVDSKSTAAKIEEIDKMFSNKVKP